MHVVDCGCAGAGGRPRCVVLVDAVLVGAGGLSIRQIAERLGRAPSTISRELRRNASSRGGDRPFEAHRQATARRARHHLRRLDTDHQLGDLVAELLAQRWSPQQISRHLKGRFPDNRSRWLCHESIYQAVCQPGSSLLRPSKVAPQHRCPLRTGRDHRRAHQNVERRRPRFAQPILTVHHRPFSPADRSEPGHWEGDLIIGKSQGSAIGTLVGRQRRRRVPVRPADLRALRRLLGCEGGSGESHRGCLEQRSPSTSHRTRSPTRDGRTRPSSPVTSRRPSAS
jgi:transposase, IS30 family